MAEKAKDTIGPDKIKKGVDKTAEKVDDVTGGKGRSQVDKGRQVAKDAVDKLGDDEN